MQSSGVVTTVSVIRKVQLKWCRDLSTSSVSSGQKMNGRMESYGEGQKGSTMFCKFRESIW